MTSFEVALVSAALTSGAAAWLLAPAGVARRRLVLLRTPARGSGTGDVRPNAAPRARALHEHVLSVPRRLRSSRRRAAEERSRRRETIELCYALAVELRAGRTPAGALGRAVEVDGPESGAELAAVVAATRTGDVADALWEAGKAPGARGLRRLSACWRVGSGAGAGFALAVERLAGALRAEEQHRQEVAAQLAGPRSTMRLLAMLPLVGLLMSTAMGLRPLGFLFGTPYGLTCLAAGTALDIAGVAWTRKLARSAEDNR